MSALISPISSVSQNLTLPEMRLQKRDGSLAPFDGERIRAAIGKALCAGARPR